MPLHDETPAIVAPGCWDLLGGHLDPGETPEQGLRGERLESQDMALVSSEELLAGSIWSTHLGTHRQLANGLLKVMQHVLSRQV